MEKIMQYIKAGKGRGLIFLLAAAVVISFVGIIFLKQIYNSAEPKFMLVADEFLPITVQEGKIVNPIDTYKKVDFKFGNVLDNSDVLPIVLDTRKETSTIPEAKLGIFIMTDIVYIISPNKIEKFYLPDGVWDKDAVKNYFDSFISTVSLFIAGLLVAILFLFLLIKTIIIAWLSELWLKAMKKTNLPDFAAFMRLSAVIVAILNTILMVLGVCCSFSLNIWVRGIIALALVISTILKLSEQDV